MSNPFKTHTVHLFADRETIDEAMSYSTGLIMAMEEGPSKIAAWTAFMVLVNTAAKVWPETQPEAPALFTCGCNLAQVQADLDHRLAALANRVGDLEQQALALPVVTDVALQTIQSCINDWVSDEFDARADEWLNDHADLDSQIENWAENNLDVEDAVRDVLRDANLSISF